MPTSNDMQKVLDIQDKNMIFEDHCVSYDVHKQKKCKFIDCTLTYIPTKCKKCQISNKEYTIIKNGTQTSRITVPMTGIYPTYLRVKKQRFKCKACEATFTAETPIVKEHCFISNFIKAEILMKSADARSIKSLSEETNVSHATIQRIINEQAKEYRPYYHSLPENLSFDEFKYGEGQMAFEYIDVVSGTIVDILESKDTRTIKNHFRSRYSQKQRSQVKTITTDMNASYVSFIPELFPNADIIIDRFHIIQLVNRSMNKTRVKVMNRLRTSNGEDQKKYRRLKRFWKKLLKKESAVSYTDYQYFPLFGQRLEAAIISEMLAYDSELKETYRVYQAILKAVEHNDSKQLRQLLDQSTSPELSGYMKTSLKTLRAHFPHIQNTFYYPYNNGKIEGINNKIKVLNRVAYGYRNFIHYKNRIILHFNLKPIKSKLNTIEKGRECPAA
ncbi:ISL3 family transposase [Marinilactibacillus psychrotolerans]|uniref:ISL3 family transposase n=1 Tax=Marinilactibacillus psychrotolerans TaxID=191770 RepID=UPI00388938E5